MFFCIFNIFVSHTLLTVSDMKKYIENKAYRRHFKEGSKIKTMTVI